MFPQEPSLSTLMLVEFSVLGEYSALGRKHREVRSRGFEVLQFVGPPLM